MTILVDEIREYPVDWVKSAARKHGGRWCHLASDVSHEELHEFAAGLGLRREWFQGDHYDLTPGMRYRAIRAGAVETSGPELIKRMKKARPIHEL